MLEDTKQQPRSNNMYSSLMESAAVGGENTSVLVFDNNPESNVLICLCDEDSPSPPKETVAKATIPIGKQQPQQ